MGQLLRQMTAAVYIVADDKVLLLYHKKLRKWLPPGGHLDPNETPPEGALREAKEETGLDVAFIAQENVWIERWNAKSFERPFLCLIEEIPAHGGQPEHQHIDFVYIARPIGNGALTQNTVESDGLAWYTLEEVEDLIDDEEIFVETKEVIRVVFNKILTIGVNHER